MLFIQSLFGDGCRVMNVDLSSIRDFFLHASNRLDCTNLYSSTQSVELISAAVLVPLVVRDAQINILFTKRTEHLHHHPGQISFPGGQVEPGDFSLIDTALRETEEEIGLDRRCVELIGPLPDYLTGTGFCVTPVVGLVRTPFTLALDTFEVAEAFEVPLSHFLDPANHQRHSMEYQGQIRHFHAMPYNDYYIWGATAGIIMSLYQLLQAGQQVERS